MPMPLKLRNKTLVRRLTCTGTPHRYAKREDGLKLCERCGGLEGALLATCPLVRLSMDEVDLSYEIFCRAATPDHPTIADFNAAAGAWNDAALDEFNREKKRREA